MTWPVSLELGRVSNLPTVWTNVLAGAVLAGEVHAPQLAVLGLAFSLYYLGGMFLNDAYDRVLDQEERPGRPIPSGRVSTARALRLGYGMLVAGVGVVGAATFTWTGRIAWAPLGSSVLLAALIIGYDIWHQDNPASPFIMGLCRALVYITTALAVSGRLPPPVLVGALALWAYVVGLTWVARSEPRDRVKVPRAVSWCIAGICLLDALLIAGRGQHDWVWLAVLGFLLTGWLQRLAPGT